MSSKIRFILRNENFQRVDVQGNSSDVVYLVPAEWATENIWSNLPAGVRMHNYSDYVGIHHAINVVYDFDGKPSLETGNVTTWD